MNNYVKLLKAARVKIASGKERFLCRALTSAASKFKDPIMTKIAAMLVRRIMAKITADNEFILTVESWLKKNSDEYCAWYYTVIGNQTEYRRVMKEYRLLWIDALIAEYQKLK